MILKAVVAFVISNGVIFLLYFRSEEFKYLFDVVKNFKGIMKNNEVDKQD